MPAASCRRRPPPSSRVRCHPPRPPSTLACVQLLEGQAEVFGSSLGLGERVTIGGQKVAVFTWKGCRLQLEGQPDIM